MKARTLVSDYKICYGITSWEPKPYVYILQLPIIQAYYIGARCQNVKEGRKWEDDLLKCYQTSSSRKQYISEDVSVFDIIECDNHEIAFTCERVLIKAFVENSIQLLNIHIANGVCNTIGLRQITNGEDCRYIFPFEEVPENWYFGRSLLTKEKLSNAAKDKIQITDGYINKWQNIDNPLPDGFKKGNTRSEAQRQKVIERNSSKKGFTYINNGRISKFQNKLDPIPEGQVIGRKFNQNSRKSGTKIKINDGMREKIQDKEFPIPIGFVRGGLNSKYRNYKVGKKG